MVFDYGKVVDILMGFMLLVGIIMSICFGDIDVLIILFLMCYLGIFDVEDFVDILNYKLGLFGILGLLFDMCDFDKM